MEELEYRVLTACANTLFPLRLIRKDPADGFAVSDIISVVCRLFEDGDVFATSASGLIDCLTDDGVEDVSRLSMFVPAMADIEFSIVAGNPELYFGMNSKAATRWEAFAQPDWDRYINDAVYRYDEVHKNFEQNMWSRTRSRLEEAIRFHYSGEAVPGTELWSHVSPWRATYWKTLPSGHHVKLRVRDQRIAPVTDGETKWSRTLGWHRSPSECH